MPELISLRARWRAKVTAHALVLQTIASTKQARYWHSAWPTSSSLTRKLTEGNPPDVFREAAICFLSMALVS